MLCSGLGLDPEATRDHFWAVLVLVLQDGVGHIADRAAFRR